MITTNYQTYGSGFNLRLRIYLEGDTKYVTVNKLLQGKRMCRCRVIFGIKVKRW